MAKTLLDKLGFKSGMTGWVRDCPVSFAETLPLSATRREEHPSLILSFVATIAEVEAALAAVLPHYARGRALWFAYPKKSGTIRSDVTRDRGWETLVAADLLPVTQIALDDDWSALRFRYRDEIPKMTRATDTHKPAA